MYCTLFNETKSKAVSFDNVPARKIRILDNSLPWESLDNLICSNLSDNSDICIKRFKTVLPER